MEDIKKSYYQKYDYKKDNGMFRNKSDEFTFKRDINLQIVEYFALPDADDQLCQDMLNATEKEAERNGPQMSL